jgi:DNA-binding MurR/RpiR family transcriptional regulator
VEIFAKAIATAKRRLVVTSGSAVARALEHNASLAGYCSELVDGSVSASNAIADMQAGDIVIALALWRLYRSTAHAVRQDKTLRATDALLFVKRRFERR